MSEMTADQKDKLMTDLRQVVADAEALLKMTASDMSEGTAGLRERLQQSLLVSKDKLLTLQTSATEKAREIGHKADDYVHENPWQSIAIGAGLGLVVGLLMGRR